MPEAFRQLGGAASTLHPAALAIVVFGVLLMWLLPRRQMLVPFLVLGILIPLQQQVVVFGLHFMVLRILLLCAWMRIIPDVVRGTPFLAGGVRTIDKIFFIWVTWVTCAYTLHWGNTAALVTKLGFLYNAFLIYYLLRHTLRDIADAQRLMRIFAVICAVVAILMIVEQLTGRNLLAVFGAPAESEVRREHIRAQGPFMHSIIAGTFGAVLAPAFAGLWWMRGTNRRYAIVGFISATIIIVTSASSTPIGAYLAGILAMVAWSLRRQMRAIRWGTLAALVSLQLVMKSPVWSLIHRVDFVGGSTGWQRFLLVDECIHHFGEWWLIGTTNNPNWGFDMWDTANWYVGSCVSGGLLALISFVGIIVLAFTTVGRVRRRYQDDPGGEHFVWGLGAALFAGCVSFLGIELFDQSIVAWYALLALIGAVAGTREILKRSAPLRDVLPHSEFACNPQT
jgi:hypothetical protein